jgi:L,D-transpeptidase catalytic domain
MARALMSALLAIALVAPLGGAQSARRDSTIDSLGIAAAVASVTSSSNGVVKPQPAVGFRSRGDSIASVRTRLAADRSSDLRIVVSLNDRMLWAVMGHDTLLTAPVAVSTDETLSYAGKSWTFETPRGVRTVLAKQENPVWIPPDWHYAEVAREEELKLAPMSPGRTKLSDGNWLELRFGLIGLVDSASGKWALLPKDEEIIFDNTLFIPPIGSVNRRVEGELGRHMLDTGNGFLLHGTPHKASIGTAATHGCIRLRDEDIQWLYDMMPVGTRVYIY